MLHDSDNEDEDRDDRRKRLANIRQKKYYQKNKESVTAGFQQQRNKLKSCERKEERAKKRKNKKIEDAALAALAQLNIREPEHAPDLGPQIPDVIEPAKKGRKANTVFTIEYIKDKLKDIQPESTKKTYFAALDVIFRVSNSDDMGKFIKQYSVFKKHLETAKKMRGSNEEYGLSALRTHIKMIVICCDPEQPVKIPVKPDLFEKYREWYKVVTLKYDEERIVAKENPDNAVMLFPQYKEKILENYGEDSKQFLIVSMYDEVTLRDDYGELLIVSSDRDIKNNKGNYLINPRGLTVNCKLVIQSYKTSEHNGTLRYNLSRSLTKLLRNYIENNDLTDKLFPTYFTSGLSQVVTQMSKKLGINSKGGTNYLRHSKITTMLSNSNISPEERIKLATSMGHSVNIQSEYERLIKV
jgi:hypothetical protein